MSLPEPILKYADLRCCYIWRSIGTHIWFEFGTPQIKLLKSGRRAVEGELTLHIAADNWRLHVDGQCVLNAGNVTDENFKLHGPHWFLGQKVPVFVEKTSDVLKLRFSPSVDLLVYPNSFDVDESEVSIKLPDGSYYDFDFQCGWTSFN